MKDRTTGKVVVREMRISEMVQMLADDPNLDVIPGQVGRVEPRLHTKNNRPSEGFKDVLRTIKKNNPGSTIDVDGGRTRR